MKGRLDRGQIEVLDDALADVLRRKTPAERIEMIAAAHRTARQLIAAGVRHQHPDWDDPQVAAHRRRPTRTPLSNRSSQFTRPLRPGGDG